MIEPKTLRRSLAVAVAFSMLGAFAACGGGDEGAGDGTGSSTGASTVFVPGSAPPMLPLPPGAGPHAPNPNPDPGDPPPRDAAPDVPAKDSAPADATGQ